MSGQLAATTATTATRTTVRAAPADAPETQLSPPRRDDDGDGIGWYITRSVLSMISMCLLALIANLVVLSHLQHASAQHNLLDRLRMELANGVAPVQAVDPASHQLIDEGSPIGILRIPDIGVSEVVVFGSTSGVLTKGVGLRRDSVFPGQLGSSFILGRAAAYGGPFSDLNKLLVGNTFSVTTGQGIQQFAVVAIRRTGDLLPPPPPSGSRLTLITAAGSAYLPTGLLRVDADLIGKVQPTPPHAVTSTGLRAEERSLAGDPTNIWYLVFALQTLLVMVVGGVFAWRRWGHMQAWVVCAPVVLLAGLWVADNVTALLPNLM